MELEQTRQQAIAIAREAGELLRRGFGQQLELATKSSTIDWVTQFDLASEKLIVERLTTAFHGHTLIGEEGGRRTAAGDYCWYIDPLDGTNNFAHGYPVFCVSLALYQGERPLVGVVCDPLRDECFHAAAGQGATATRNGLDVPLSVSGNDNLNHALLATGYPYDKAASEEDNLRETYSFVKRAQDVRRSGSAAIDLAYVAAGRLDGYWEYKLSTWDVAAGLLLVQEAGGRVTGMDGGGFVLQYPLNLVISNGRLHAIMLDVLAQLRNTSRDG